MEELAERGRHGSGRLPAIGSVGCAGPRGRRTCRPPSPIGDPDCRPAPDAAAGSVSRATRTSPPTPPPSPKSRSTRVVRLLRVWCAADAGLVINPDGALNQLEGGIIQAASWALKEGVRLDAGGISSRDWESYPVLRFSEVPEVLVELVNPSADLPPLGVGEASGGPHRRRDRQCRRACPRHPPPRPAADPRPRHGGVAEGVTSGLAHPTAG